MKSVICLIALMISTAALANDIEPKPIEPAPTPVAIEKPVEIKPLEKAPEVVSGGFYKSIYMGYNMATNGWAPYTITSGAVNSTGEFTFEMETAFLLGVEIGNNTRNRFGWDIGFTREASRDLKRSNYAMKTPTVSTISASNYGTSIVLSGIYVDTVYNFEKSYLKFGANFSLPSVSSISPTLTVSGTTGLQAGFGVYVNDQVAIDLMYKNQTIMASELSSGVRFNYQTIYFNGAQITLKYMF